MFKFLMYMVMKLSLSTTFNFGFPNLSSLIQSFPDIFSVSSEKSLNERSDVRLNPDCPCKLIAPVSISTN